MIQRYSEYYELVGDTTIFRISLYHHHRPQRLKTSRTAHFHHRIFIPPRPSFLTISQHPAFLQNLFPIDPTPRPLRRVRPTSSRPPISSQASSTSSQAPSPTSAPRKSGISSIRAPTARAGDSRCRASACRRRRVSAFRASARKGSRKSSICRPSILVTKKPASWLVMWPDE